MLAEIKMVATKVRKLVTCHWIHHPKADIKCLSVKSKNGGIGLIPQELTHKTATFGLKKYFDSITDWVLQLVNIQKNQKKKIFNQRRK